MTETARLVIAVDSTQAKKADDALDKLGRTSSTVEKNVGSLTSAVKGLAGPLAAFLSVREVYQATEAYTGMTNRLRLVTSSAVEMAAAQDAVFRVAQAGRQPLTETAELYQRIATNQTALGLSGAGVARITETISKSLAVSGTSAAEAAGALTQLGQAFASGALRGDELNSVLEGAPALAQALAKGMGVTVGQLRALGAEGAITSQVLVDALLKQSDEMDATFSKLAPNISGAVTTVSNSLTQLVGKMDSTAGASSGVSEAILKIADALDDPETIQAAQTLGSGIATAIGWITTATTNAVNGIKWFSEELAARFGGIAIGDIDRLEAEASRLQELLNKMEERGETGYAIYGSVKADYQDIQKRLQQGYDLAEMVETLGSRSGSAAPKLEEFRSGVSDLSDSLGESSGKADKQAKAFQALYDSLYPAEAAQRQYTEEVALLKAELSGDKLADAIHRLNFAMEGADATGPADAVEEYRKELERLEDKINPAGKAAKDFAAEQKRLREEIERTGDPTGKWTALLHENERQFEQNTRATSEWAKWTEGALDRVDGAFADAWRNIGDGFSSFRDSLTDAFKQMLAELAHMAITRPIVMQIGAALGIGGGAGQAVSMLGGTAGSGGLDAFGLLRNGYSIANSGFGQAVAQGWGNGGFSGAISNGWNYGSNALGSFFGSGAANSGGSAIADYTGAQFGNWVGAQNAAATTWGSAATGMGAIAGGLSGAYMGYQRSGIKGAVAGGVGGWGGGTLGTMAGAAAASALSGTAMGAALGSVLPGIGTVIGAALGAAFGSKLFGGAWETKDAGLAFSVEGGQFDAQQFEYQKKKGGLFSSNKKRTRFSALDEETAAQFQGAFDATGDTVASIFETLSLTVEESSLAGLQMAREKISTKGKTEEEIQEAISEWFLSLGNSMTAELNKVFSTGLDYDLAGMQAFVGNLQGVNEVLRYLDVSMYDMTVAGGKLAESLAAASGGLDALATNSQTYYAAFFSEAEKVEDTVDSIKRAFESADVELVGSREAYRAMVEDIDLTTEAGQEMFSLMMALSGQAAQYFSIVEQQAAQATAAANAALFGAVDTAYAALQRSIAAQQQEIQQAASATASNITALTGVSNSLDAALKRLRGTSDETVRSLRAQAVMTLNSALVTARSGGSLAGFEGLQDALDTASQMDTALYSSLTDFEREQGRTANLIAELEKVNGKQLNTEQLLLKELERQSAQLNAELDFAQAQLDALNGIDNSVKSVEAAVAAMNASVVAALSGMADGLASKNTTANNSALIDSVYKSVLGRETDDAGKAFWQQQLASGDLDYDQLAKAIANDASKNANDPGAGSAADYLKNQGGLSVQDQVEAAYRAVLGRSADAAGESYWMGQVSSGMSVADLIAAIERDAKVNGEIPSFASGGFHSGGLRLVGENGPELEVTGPSRIYSASQTAAMMNGGGDTARAIAGLQQSVDRQGDALRSIAKHTMNTAKRVEFLERWDYDGLPTERDVA